MYNLCTMERRPHRIVGAIPPAPPFLEKRLTCPLNVSVSLQLLIRWRPAVRVGVELRQSCPFLKLESHYSIHIPAGDCFIQGLAVCLGRLRRRFVEFCRSAAESSLEPWIYWLAHRSEDICSRLYSLSFLYSGFIMRTSN